MKLKYGSQIKTSTIRNRRYNKFNKGDQMKITCLNTISSYKNEIFSWTKRIKGYGFLSFAKSMGKSLSNKYGQKFFDSAKKSTKDAIKTA